MRTIALCCLILFTVMANAAVAEQVGDMDDDGQVGVKEAIIALQIAAGLTPGVPLGQYVPASGNATPSDVLATKTFTNDSGPATGAMPIQSLSNTTTTVSGGYYNATNLAIVDADLATGNIRSGTIIFGIDGDTNVVNTSSGDAQDEHILLGKKAWVDGEVRRGTTGLFWGCRPGSTEWVPDLLLTDCLAAGYDPALCEYLFVNVSLELAPVSGTICGGTGGM